MAIKGVEVSPWSWLELDGWFATYLPTEIPLPCLAEVRARVVADVPGKCIPHSCFPRDPARHDMLSTIIEINVRVRQLSVWELETEPVQIFMEVLRPGCTVAVGCLEKSKKRVRGSAKKPSNVEKPMGSHEGLEVGFAHLRQQSGVRDTVSLIRHATRRNSHSVKNA